MKHAQKTTLIKGDDGLIWGIDLGYGWRQEHNNGLAGLLRHLNVDSSGQPGLPRQTMKFGFPLDRASSHLVFAEGITVNEKLPDPSRPGETTKIKSVVDILYCHRRLAYSRVSSKSLKVFVPERRVVSSAESQWDSDGFAIVAYSDETKGFLRELHASLFHGDVAVWLSNLCSATYSSDGGLLIAIASRVPESVKQALLKADINGGGLQSVPEVTVIDLFP